MSLSNGTKGLEARRAADVRIGAWLSAAMDDPAACKEFKADIELWFSTRDIGFFDRVVDSLPNELLS